MILSLLAVHLLGNKKRNGFVSFVLANATWIGLGIFLMQSYGIAVGNAVFLVMNVRGYFRWKKQTA